MNSARMPITTGWVCRLSDDERPGLNASCELAQRSPRRQDVGMNEEWT